MANLQKFLMDDRKAGRLLKVETFEKTVTKKKKKVTKKHYLITVYIRVKVKENIFKEDGTTSEIENDKFVKWAEFTWAEAMHPKDRIIELLTKIERPMSYITDEEITEEAENRGLIDMTKFTDQILINELKRRGLTKFANTFLISKNATVFQKLKARIAERKKIPDTKLSFEDTLDELIKRNLVVPKDFLSNDKFVSSEDLLEALNERDARTPLERMILKSGPAPINSDDDVIHNLEGLFENEIPQSAEVLDINDIRTQ